MGARIEGKMNTKSIDSHAHCQTVSVVSFITAPTAVVGAAEDPIDVDISGKLGISELHDAKSNKSRRYLIMCCSHIQQKTQTRKRQRKR